MKPEREFCQALATELRKERIAAQKTQNEVYCETKINMARLEKGIASIELFTFLILCRYFNAQSDVVLKRLESNFGNNFKRNPKPESVRESDPKS